MHPAGGKTLANLFPEEGTDFITHNPIQHPARLLCVDQLHVNFARVFHTVGDAGFGDFIEGHTVILIFTHTQNLGQMPRNRLSFAIRVGCEINLLAFSRSAFELFDQLLLALDVLIGRGKTMLRINAQFAFGQVADMPHRGHDLIARAQILFNRFGFCRRLHNY